MHTLMAEMDVMGTPQETASAADARRHFQELEALRRRASAEGTPLPPVAPQPQLAPKQAPTTGLAAPAVRGHLSPARPSEAQQALTPKRAEVRLFWRRRMHILSSYAVAHVLGNWAELSKNSTMQAAASHQGTLQSPQQGGRATIQTFTQAAATLPPAAAPAAEQACPVGAHACISQPGT
jgi:hypothetical protein